MAHDDSTEGIFRRILEEEGHRLARFRCANGRLVEISGGNGELRLRDASQLGLPVRLDLERLVHMMVETEAPLTQEGVEAWLCMIVQTPESYRDLLARGDSARADRSAG